MSETSIGVKRERIWVIFFTKLHFSGQKENVKMHSDHFCVVIKPAGGEYELEAG